jgi:hypothetical protein
VGQGGAGAPPDRGRILVAAKEVKKAGK